MGSIIPCSQVSRCDVDDEENTRVATTPDFTFPCDTRPIRQHCPKMSLCEKCIHDIWDDLSILGSVRYSAKIIHQLFDDCLK